MKCTAATAPTPAMSAGRAAPASRSGATAATARAGSRRACRGTRARGAALRAHGVSGGAGPIIEECRSGRWATSGGAEARGLRRSGRELDGGGRHAGALARAVCRAGADRVSGDARAAVRERRASERLAVERRDRFFAVAAQELDAPLVTLRGHVATLDAWSATPERVAALTREVDQLRELVSELGRVPAPIDEARSRRDGSGRAGARDHRPAAVLRSRAVGDLARGADAGVGGSGAAGDGAARASVGGAARRGRRRSRWW